jgi:hypothetical protein
LRRYRLRPGAHETLAGVFGRRLVSPQEDSGMQVLGWFVDAAEPDHFVWLRGFPGADPDVRAEALQRFYGGPVWAAHRDAANATMLDSDDVLLLAPAAPGSGLEAAPARHAAELRVVTFPLHHAPLPAAILGGVLAIPGPADACRAVLVSAEAPNRFPALPVREDPALVWVERAEDPEADARVQRVAAALERELAGLPEVAILRPARGSPTPGIPHAGTDGHRAA